MYKLHQFPRKIDFSITPNRLLFLSLSLSLSLSLIIIHSAFVFWYREIFLSLFSSFYFFLFRLGIKSECCEEDMNNSRNAYAPTASLAHVWCSFSFEGNVSCIKAQLDTTWYAKHSLHSVRSMQSTFIPFSLFRSSLYLTCLLFISFFCRQDFHLIRLLGLDHSLISF